MLRSANMCFRRRFSSSKAFVWPIMAASIPPHFARHVLNIAPAHPVLPAQFRHGHPALCLTQHARYLGFGEAARRHRNLIVDPAERIPRSHPPDHGEDCRCRNPREKSGQLGRVPALPRSRVDCRMDRLTSFWTPSQADTPHTACHDGITLRLTPTAPPTTSLTDTGWTLRRPPACRSHTL